MSDIIKPYTLQWNGNRALISELLVQIREQAKETNRLLTTNNELLSSIDNKFTDNNTLLTMIADNTNCACEQLKRLGDNNLPDGFYIKVDSEKLTSYDLGNLPKWKDDAEDPLQYFTFDIYSIVNGVFAEYSEGDKSENGIRVFEQDRQENSVRVTIGVNSNHPPRDLFLNLVQEGTGKTILFTAKQDGFVFDFEFKDHPAVNQIEETFLENIFDRDIYVTSLSDGLPSSWGIKTIADDWLTVTKTSNFGGGISIHLSPNLSTSNRTSTIVLKQDYSDLTLTIKVHQHPSQDFRFYLTNYYPNNPNNINVEMPPEGQLNKDTPITSTLNSELHGYTAEVNQDWITFEITPTVFKYTLKKNALNTDRQATITLTQKDSNKIFKIYINQRRLNLIEFYFKENQQQTLNKTVGREFQTLNIEIVSLVNGVFTDILIDHNNSQKLPTMDLVSIDYNMLKINLLQNSSPNNHQGYITLYQKSSQKEVTLFITQTTDSSISPP